ncbi:MAG: hypothetical protein JW736_10735 [Deltaproteobacteria bacterium]|nr:hypothetical protein [Deltaproteobacteria bacterium]MBN2686611.1 hypothetical protein [Deltaproteobacteria bacterium]
MMKFLSQISLTKREKLYVVGGASAVVIFLFIQFLLFPLFDAKAKMKRSIERNERILQEIIELRSDYHFIKNSTDSIRAALKKRDKDFTLFSFLEKQAGRAGVKTNITYMKPSTETDTGPYRESSVEMKLEGITLKQLVDYLYFIESPRDLVQIKRISIKQSSSQRHLTVLIHALTYLSE